MGDLGYEGIPLEASHEPFKFNIGVYCVYHVSHPHATHSELSSVALGGKIVNLSDEFFAEAFHLLKVEVSSTTMTSRQAF